MSEKKKLKNLRKFRNGHRSFVRKTIASATELLSGGNPIDVKKLNLFRAALQTKYSELQALDQEIAELLDDVSKIEEDVVESCELSSAIHACILELEIALAAEEAQRKSQELGSGSAGISQSQPPNVIMHAKLPKLELRKFHGNPIEWYPFWESFESAVHKKPNLSGVDKFNYLKSLLVGTAQNVVAGLALTSANYEKAVELLQARFGN